MFVRDLTDPIVYNPFFVGKPLSLSVLSIPAK